MQQVLYFFQKTCVNCEAIAGKVLELRNAIGGQLSYIDADEDQASVDQYGVRRVPMIILLDNGQEVGRWTDVDSVSRFIDQALQSGSGTNDDVPTQGPPTPAPTPMPGPDVPIDPVVFNNQNTNTTTSSAGGIISKIITPFNCTTDSNCKVKNNIWRILLGVIAYRTLSKRS